MKLEFDFHSNGVRSLLKDYSDAQAAHRRLRSEVEKPMRAPAVGRAGGARRPGTEAGRSPEVIAAEKEAKALARINAKKAADLTRHKAYVGRIHDRQMLAEQRAGERSEKAEAARAARVERTYAAQRSRLQRMELGQKLKAADVAAKPGAFRRSFRDAPSAIVGGIAGPAALAVGAGVAGLGLAYHKRAQLLEQAQALSSAGRGAGQEGVDPRLLMADATRVATGVRGTKSSDVMTGMARYVQMTGDLEGARDNAKNFSIVARATGSTEDQIAATVATMREKFGINDAGQMRTAMARTIQGGKSGAFEMKDASQYFTEMGAAGSRFGLDKGVEGVSQLSGLAQIAMKSAGNGAKASTGVQAMLRQLVAKGGAGKESIKALTGANVFTDSSHTKTRGVQDVLTDVIGGAGGDLTKLQKIFGDEGMVGASALITAFNEAAAAAGKDASASEKRAMGEAAVRKMLQENIEAGGDWADVQKDAAANTDNASSKLTAAWESASAAFGDKLIGPLDTLAGALESADYQGLADVVGFTIEAFAALVKWVGELTGKKIDMPGSGKDAPSQNPVSELADTQAELSSLEGKKTKTVKDRARMRELREREESLQGQVNDPNNANVMKVLSLADPGAFQPGKGMLRPEFMGGEGFSKTDAVGLAGFGADYTLPSGAKGGGSLFGEDMGEARNRSNLIDDDSAYRSFMNLAKNDMGFTDGDGRSASGPGGIKSGQVIDQNADYTLRGQGLGRGAEIKQPDWSQLLSAADKLASAADRLNQANPGHPER